MKLFRLIAKIIAGLIIFAQSSFADDWQNKLNKAKVEYVDFFYGNYNKASSGTKPKVTKSQDALCGFMLQDAKDYVDFNKTLDLRQFLSDDLEVFGVACDYSKSIREIFYITINAKWNGNEGHLAEQMNYESGKVENRIWDYKFKDSHNYTATGTNVVRTAIGKQEGNTANLSYSFITPYGSIKMHLSMDDRWFLIDANTAVNRIFMKKFGFKVGEVMMIVKKKEVKNAKKRK